MISPYLRVLLALCVIAAPALSLEKEAAVQLLRKYCSACHVSGTKRFITSDQDLVVWDYLFEHSASNGNSWAKEITRVLDWPEPGIPPPANSQMEPGREWMPVGIRRYFIVEEMVDGVDARRALLNRIRQGNGDK